ncbi:unnamed protein product [Darwinula stevensoni]|uniref:Uncharacterized protein n=1 Tax=Darwinula stevensoni TaxID=69355 RepID=A0A7R9AAK4_9CRUS|nr:unnamed protein product [Darwinula stevensoni]CAG0898558.1 unnamed protein product [Darwinula stevensoni]
MAHLRHTLSKGYLWAQLCICGTQMCKNDAKCDRISRECTSSPGEIICTLKLLSSSEVVKIHVGLAHTANFAHTLVAVRMMEPAIALQETVAAPQGGWEDFVNNNVQMATGSLNAGINVHVRTTGFPIE